MFALDLAGVDSNTVEICGIFHGAKELNPMAVGVCGQTEEDVFTSDHADDDTKDHMTKSDWQIGRRLRTDN